MNSQPQSQSSQPRAAVQSFRDGLGDRFVTTDRHSGERLEVLRLRAEFMKVPAFEFAVRERTARLAGFRHASFARVRRVDRLPQPSGRLAIVSDGVEGARLSDILQVAEQQNLTLDVDAALCVLRQIVPAVGLLHRNAREVSHGALAPERIVVSPRARVVIVEHVLGSALEQLHLSRETLWRELRIAVPSSAGLPSFDHRADIAEVGMVALALILGRPIRPDEYPDRIRDLVAEATELSALGGRQPLSTELRQWLSRALQLDPRASFLSVRDLQASLDQLLAGEAGYTAAPTALETFLARFQHRDGLADQDQSTRPAQPAVAPSAAAVVAQGTVPQAPPVPVGVPAAPSDASQATETTEVPAAPRTSATPETTETPAARAPRPAAVRPPAGRLFVAPDEVDVDEPEDTPEADIEESPARTWGPRRRWVRAAVAAIVLVALAQGALLATRNYRAWVEPAAPIVAAASSTLIVETTPPGAEVFVDGVAQGLTPVTLDVDPGAHILELRGRGAPRVVPFRVEAGEQVRHHLDLPIADRSGSLQVRTDPPGARVTIDGVTYGESPLTVGDLEPGERTIVLENAAGRVEEAVTIEAGMTASLVVPLLQATGPVTGWLSVTAPFEMLIYQNKGLIGTSANPRIILPAGRHEIEIVNESIGYHERRTVQVRAGSVASLSLQMPTGTLHLNAQPWAEVWLDDEKVGDTPIGNLELPIGPHEVVFRHPELGERRQAVMVRPDEPARVSVDMRR